MSVLPGNTEEQQPTQGLLTVLKQALDVEQLRYDRNFSKFFLYFSLKSI